MGAENRRNLIIAGVLGAVAVLVAAYELKETFAPSTDAAVASGAAAGTAPIAPLGTSPRGAAKKPKGVSGKKERPAQSLDPMLNLKELSATEQVKYEGLGRNIFVSQAEVQIPKPLTNGKAGAQPGSAESHVFVAPPPAPPPPIPLKFFGFASQKGEPKKVFLSAGEDVFIAGEGEIVDRRYKVVHISNGSVEIQDVVGSGPPQTVPLTQG